MSYLDELNERQKQAAQTVEGAVLILAGAGAGKTKTLTYRIANLIHQGVNPRNILAVTFTNKAAKEMKERVDYILEKHADFNKPIGMEERPMIKTFHSLGVYIIKENSDRLGLPKRFSILDRADSKKIVRDSLKEEGYDPKEHDPGKILSIISRKKGDMISPEEYEDSEHSYISGIVVTVWRKYEKELKNQKALDFDDLLSKAVQLLEKDSEIRERYQNLWQYIHIDEYQDTNEVQYRMAKILAEKNKNICVVGDVDQNIYSWRGATIKNIMHFEKDYPEAKEILLEENYRSTQNILQAANDIISKNVIRKEKNLFTKNGEGEKITIYRAIDEYDEAGFSVLTAKQLIDNGTPPEEICFLYRANFQSRVLEEVCLKYNLPYQVIGTRFFDRKEVKDVVAYIKSATNQDDFSSLNRIINNPTRGIGKVTILKIQAKQEESLTPAVKQKVADFRNLLKSIREQVETKTPNEVVHFILKKSGLEDKFKSEGEEGLERLENVKELASLAKKYEGENIDSPEGRADAMENFLEDISLVSDQDEMNRQTDGVKLMTVHAAKGLEFDAVFVTGLETGLFPHEKFGEEKEDEEEERRLFYVAITRAKKKLYLTWTTFRTIFGSKEINTPSDFLADISEDLISEEEFGEGGNSENGSDKKEYLIDF